MIKTLLLAMHILTTQYNIESVEDIPTAMAYSWSRAECKLGDEPYQACVMACTADLDYLAMETITKDMPACEGVFNDLGLNNE